MTTFFSSRRERRLWTWTLLIVLAIYGSIGVAGTLAGLVPEMVLGIAFFVCMILVAITIVTQGLRTRPGGREIGVAVGVAAVYLLLSVRLAVAERTHLLEYSVVAVLIYEALTERLRHGRRVPFPAGIAMAGRGTALSRGSAATSPARGRGDRRSGRGGSRSGRGDRRSGRGDSRSGRGDLCKSPRPSGERSAAERPGEGGLHAVALRPRECPLDLGTPVL
jgi:uncharacterized membrane protein YgcG